MALGTRFIHTADWQLGLRAHHVPGDRGAIVREARVDTVRRIADAAKQAGAEFVVVAGDVFEHHALDREPLQRVFEALRTFPCEVFLLPGNHDPYTPDALYRTEWWKRECPPQVKVLGRPRPVDIGNVTLLPCPLLERDNRNATGWLHAPDEPSDRVRVGVAHGGVTEILRRLVGDAEAEFHNDIPIGLSEHARLDYLALGDWHGCVQVNARTWYSGTPEPTRFQERNPGDILLVELEGPQATPRVTQHRVARFRWQLVEHTLLAESDVTSLEQSLDAIPDPLNTLIDLVLTGQLSVALHHRVLEETVPRQRARFHHLRLRDEKFSPRLIDSDIAMLPVDGWVGTVVRALQSGVAHQTPEACHEALQQLYRLHHGLQFGGGT